MSCRKQRSITVFLILLSSVFYFEKAFCSNQITSIDFQGTSDPHKIIIQGNSAFEFEKKEDALARQVIIEIKNSKISKSNSASIDTSSFKSNVVSINPSQVEGKKDLVQVMIQLKEFNFVDVEKNKNQLVIKIPQKNFSTLDSFPAGAPDLPTSSSLPPSPILSTPPASTSQQPLLAGQPKSVLDDFMASKASKTFSGKPITLQVKEADVEDVLRLIGEASGFNMIVGDDVKGKITLSLTDVPWDQALDVVLHTLHLGAERNNNILRVVTLANLTREKEEELSATKAVEAGAPRITKIFPISYANPVDLQNILYKFSSNPFGASGSSGAAGGSTGAGAQAGGSSSSGGSSPVAGSANMANPNSLSIVQYDNRTNSMIIRDLPENIDRMAKLIEILDTQTPQVIIEAKIIEATENFSKSLAGSLGLGSSDQTVLASFSGADPINTLVSSTISPFSALAAGASAVSSAGTTGSTSGTSTSSGGASTQSGPKNGRGILGVSPVISFFKGSLRLNALINWGEDEGLTKVVSSPKLVVMNKQKATILQGQPVLIAGTTTVTGVGPSVPTQTMQSADVSLTVTPTVTNDGSVLLDLTVSKDVSVQLSDTQSGIGKRNMNTLVLVESGSTLAIGGIYSMTETKSSSGIPYLRKIPWIGGLFGSELNNLNRTELFIFITPRILNPKEAGLNAA